MRSNRQRAQVEAAGGGIPEAFAAANLPTAPTPAPLAANVPAPLPGTPFGPSALPQAQPTPVAPQPVARPELPPAPSLSPPAPVPERPMVNVTNNVTNNVTTSDPEAAAGEAVRLTARSIRRTVMAGLHQ